MNWSSVWLELNLSIARLHHTNIVPIHVVGCEEGVHYYPMQFIEGKSLAAVADEMQQKPVSGMVRETLTNSAASPKQNCLPGFAAFWLM